MPTEPELRQALEAQHIVLQQVAEFLRWFKTHQGVTPEFPLRVVAADRDTGEMFTVRINLLVELLDTMGYDMSLATAQQELQAEAEDLADYLMSSEDEHA
jgi:hypothetical protein